METTTNAMKRFKRVLGGTSKQVAEVISIANDGTSLVELRNGKRFIARGDTVAMGDNAWIVNGEIISKAPDLPSYAVTI